MDNTLHDKSLKFVVVSQQRSHQTNDGTKHVIGYMSYVLKTLSSEKYYLVVTGALENTSDFLQQSVTWTIMPHLMTIQCFVV